MVLISGAWLEVERELKRRTLLVSGMGVLPFLGRAQQPFAARPVKLVVPFPAGGSPDLIARFLADKLGTRWPAPMVVENRAGASGGLGVQQVIQSPADGYTLLMASTGPLTVNPAVNPRVGYNPVTQLEPVMLVGKSALVLMVHPGVQATNMQELVALARRQPDQLSYASAGLGNLTHLVAEMMKLRADVKILHIPYKGTAEVKSDLLAGRVSMSFDTIPAAMPLIRGGQVRALAVTSRERSPGAPNIPTFAESGLGADFDVSGWFAIVAPAGTPRELVERLNQDINKVLQTPEAQERFKAWGIDIVGGPPSRLSTLMTSDLARWQEVVRAANVKVE